MSQIIPAVERAMSFAAWTRSTRRSMLQEMLSVASRPGILSLALGLPAADLFPVEAYSRAASSVLAEDQSALQYGPPSQSLKRHIVALMARRGVHCREEQVFLTAGAQQGLSLLTRLLLDPGGKVLAEELTYTGFQQVIEPFQPDILTVPIDPETGMDVNAVEMLLESGQRPAFIYTITDGHNPRALSLSADKRRRLVELARHYAVPIIEDDPYGFLYYDDTYGLPLRALDEEWVFYVGSFSKILAPALRVGWLIVPETLMPQLSIIKESSDIDTATFSQRTVAAYLDSGHLTEHLTSLRSEYRVRRDTMLRALHQYFPREARWQKPSCGVFVWVELPETVEAESLLRRAVETEQVAFIPGQAFRVGECKPAVNSLRLNFSHNPPDRIEEGIRRLARALEAE